MVGAGLLVCAKVDIELTDVATDGGLVFVIVYVECVVVTANKYEIFELY